MASIALSFGYVVKTLKDRVTKGLDFSAMRAKAEIQFEALTGTLENAKRHIASLANFAATTPFQLGGIAAASRHLLVYGGRALAGEKDLRIFGDAAAVAGVQLQEVTFWAGRLYSSMKSGRPAGESMMRLQEMGLISGVARNKIEDLAKTVGGGEKAFALFKEELQKFEGTMVKMSETSAGLKSTLDDLRGQVGAHMVESLKNANKEWLKLSIQWERARLSIYDLRAVLGEESWFSVDGIIRAWRKLAADQTFKSLQKNLQQQVLLVSQNIDEYAGKFEYLNAVIKAGYSDREVALAAYIANNEGYSEDLIVQTFNFTREQIRALDKLVNAEKDVFTEQENIRLDFQELWRNHADTIRPIIGDITRMEGDYYKNALTTAIAAVDELEALAKRKTEALSYVKKLTSERGDVSKFEDSWNFNGEEIRSDSLALRDFIEDLDKLDSAYRAESILLTEIYNKYKNLIDVKNEVASSEKLYESLISNASNLADQYNKAFDKISGTDLTSNTELSSAGDEAEVVLRDIASVAIETSDIVRAAVEGNTRAVLQQISSIDIKSGESMMRLQEMGLISGVDRNKIEDLANVVSILPEDIEITEKSSAIKKVLKKLGSYVSDFYEELRKTRERNSDYEKMLSGEIEIVEAGIPKFNIPGIMAAWAKYGSKSKEVAGITFKGIGKSISKLIDEAMVVAKVKFNEFSYLLDVSIHKAMEFGGARLRVKDLPIFGIIDSIGRNIDTTDFNSIRVSLKRLFGRAEVYFKESFELFKNKIRGNQKNINLSDIISGEAEITEAGLPVIAGAMSRIVLRAGPLVIKGISKVLSSAVPVGIREGLKSAPGAVIRALKSTPNAIRSSFKDIPKEIRKLFVDMGRIAKSMAPKLTVKILRWMLDPIGQIKKVIPVKAVRDFIDAFRLPLNTIVHLVQRSWKDIYNEFNDGNINSSNAFSSVMEIAKENTEKDIETASGIANWITDHIEIWSEKIIGSFGNSGEYFKAGFESLIGVGFTDSINKAEDGLESLESVINKPINAAGFNFGPMLSSLSEVTQEADKTAKGIEGLDLTNVFLTSPVTNFTKEVNVLSESLEGVQEEVNELSNTDITSGALNPEALRNLARSVEEGRVSLSDLNQEARSGFFQGQGLLDLDLLNGLSKGREEFERLGRVWANNSEVIASNALMMETFMGLVGSTNPLILAENSALEESYNKYKSRIEVQKLTNDLMEESFSLLKQSEQAHSYDAFITGNMREFVDAANKKSESLQRMAQASLHVSGVEQKEINETQTLINEIFGITAARETYAKVIRLETLISKYNVDVAQLTKKEFQALAKVYYDSAQAGNVLTEQQQRLADSFDDTNKKADTFANTLRRAFEGGGDVIGAIKSHVTGLVSGSLDTAESGIGKWLAGSGTGAFASLGGAAGGAMTAGLSTALEIGLKFAMDGIVSWITSGRRKIEAMAKSYEDSFSDIISGAMSAATAFRRALAARRGEDELEDFDQLLKLEEVFKNAGQSAREAAIWQGKWNRAIDDHDANKLYSLTRELELVSEIAREREKELEILEKIQEIIDAESRIVTESEKNNNSLINQYNTLKKVRDLWTDIRTEVEKTAERLGEQWTALNNLLTDLNELRGGGDPGDLYVKSLVAEGKILIDLAKSWTDIRSDGEKRAQDLADEYVILQGIAEHWEDSRSEGVKRAEALAAEYEILASIAENWTDIRSDGEKRAEALAAEYEILQGIADNWTDIRSEGEKHAQALAKEYDLLKDIADNWEKIETDGQKRAVSLANEYNTLRQMADTWTNIRSEGEKRADSLAREYEYLMGVASTWNDIRSDGEKRSEQLVEEYNILSRIASKWGSSTSAGIRRANQLDKEYSKLEQIASQWKAIGTSTERRADALNEEYQILKGIKDTISRFSE